MESNFNIKESKIVGILDRGENNPRNSEGCFLQLDDGRIAFAYSRFTGNTFDDDAPCSICVVYSHDRGESFKTEAYETLVTATDFGFKNVMSVTLRYMDNGDIGLFYILKHAGFSDEYRLRRFSRDFKTVLSDIKCFPNGYDAYFVINNDRVIKTKNGKWIIPAALHHSGLTPDKPYLERAGIVYFFTSSDDGATWQQCKGVLHNADTYSTSGFHEPGVIELDNGVLYAYLRTDRMAQYEAVSIDGGENWFGPKPSRFTSPESPMLIKKNPHSGLYYAIWNPTPQSITNPKDKELPFWGRTPYVMAQSADGINFSNPLFIETDLTKGYCYPAIEFLDDKTFLLSYCSGGEQERCCLNRTVIRKITLE